MKGYVARKGNRYYAVVYEGLDPITGREQRSWHPAGEDRADAERLAARLANDRTGRTGRDDETRTLSFGAYLTNQWLPGKRISLAASTYNSYRRNTELHILPAIGSGRAPAPPPPSPRIAVRLQAAPRRRTATLGTQDRLRDPLGRPWWPDRGRAPRADHPQRCPCG